RKIVRWTISLFGVGLVAAGLLWAQEEPEDPVWIEAAPGPEAKIMNFNFALGGQSRLGLGIADVDAEKAKELKLPGEYGALVKRVEDDSPAAKAGIQKDDVILEFAGERVHSAAQLQRLVRETPAGRNVTLVVSRAGQARTVALKLEKREGHFAFAPGGIHMAPPIAATPVVPEFEFKLPDHDFLWFAGGSRLGISGDELTTQLAEYFGVKQGKGVLVREVVVGSAAEKAGLKAGDVIVRVDDEEVPNVSKLRRALGQRRDEKRTAKLTIVRDRKEQTLTAELEPAKPPSPRHITENIVLADPEEMKAFAEEMREHAEAMKAEARKAAEEWKKEQQHFQEEQERLQEEMKELEKERLELNDRIKNDLMMELGSGDQRA
ncbi:MAG: PDZ domain-containing protein, partial [Acidobacteria bacterium]|nr:PDZ domain-containing protein [Acidobacteriota bacterium]